MTEKDVSEISDIQAQPISAGTETPEVQLKLRDAVLRHFGDQVKRLPDHAWKAYGLSFEILTTESLPIFRKLKQEPALGFDMLVDVTVVDWLDRKEPRFEVVYHLLSTQHLHRICFKILVSEEKPETDSVRPVWASANFMEREAWDMFGVTFRGHGDLRRILMYDEFVGHPLRKDYPVRGKQPRVPLRVPELRNTSQDMYKEQLVSLPVRQRLAPKSS